MPLVHLGATYDYHMEMGCHLQRAMPVGSVLAS